MELGLNVNVTRGARALHVQVEHRERPVEVVVGQMLVEAAALGDLEQAPVLLFLPELLIRSQ